MRVVYDVIPAVNIEMRMTGEMVVVAGVITVFQQHTAAAFEFLFPRRPPMIGLYHSLHFLGKILIVLCGIS